MLVFLPKFDYIYNDLSSVPDDEIKAISNQFLVASLLVLKHTFDSHWLKGNFNGVLSIGLPYGSGDLQQAFLMYYLNRVELTKEQVIKEIKKLPSNIKDSIMSTYEMLLEEGKEKKSYTVVENLIVKLGLSDEQTADVAEVSIDFVQKVRASLTKKNK